MQREAVKTNTTTIALSWIHTLMFRASKMPSLWPYLIALWCAGAAITSAQTLEYSNGFENGAFITSPARSSETVIITSCTGATKAVNTAAARTGIYGAVAAVKAVCGRDPHAVS
jgi:hypothetical protein